MDDPFDYNNPFAYFDDQSSFGITRATFMDLTVDMRMSHIDFNIP